MANPFPNVPDVPGVPAIPRSPQAALGQLVALAELSTGALWDSAMQAPVWGVFALNEVDDVEDPNYPGSYDAVLTADSILSLDNSQEFNVPNFNIQGGEFGTFNKVTLPFEVTLTFTVTGTAADRAAFLNQLAAIAPGVVNYTIITPEYTYNACNITGFSNPRHGPQGSNRISVDVRFIQVNPVTAQYAVTQTSTVNAQDPTAEPAVSSGNVSPQPVPPQVSTAIGVSILDESGNVLGSSP